MNQQTSGILDRTLRQFRKAWRFASPGKATLKGDIAPDLPDADLVLLRTRIDACLEARGGEVSSRTRAAELGETYLLLNETGRLRFLELLSTDYGIDSDAVDRAIEARQLAEDDAARRAANSALASALVAPRVMLLRQFNGLSQGVKFLVDLRAELTRISAGSADLKALDDDLKSLLASWFDIGFLSLSRITWSTPASLLEKLIEYEAVHAIASWDDLKNRLEVDRRCYAFFHPHMPDEPLIFVQVALVNGMSGNVQQLLDVSDKTGDADSADTAIFYSISNCQRGLAGVSFGNFLIKRVVDALARDLPKLKTFATLSPIPGFRRWLEADLDEEADPLLTAPEKEHLVGLTGAASGSQALQQMISADDWWQDSTRAAVLEPLLMRLAARYLAREKRGRRALNRVAHFHLSNGARVERINWLADTSTNGMTQSLGMMVNYQYRLEDIEKNHEAYSEDSNVTTARAVAKLLKLSQDP